jgi:hypothetical protein
MSESTKSFFETVLNAGAILSGFCATFLAFRIQREAAYYRQAAVDFREGKGKDVFIGLTHFTSPFLLLLLATVCSAIFGFVFPLLALSGSAWVVSRPRLVVGGMFAALMLIGAYFLDELVHYRILSGGLVNDAREWKVEWWIVIVGILAAISCVTYFWLIGHAA